MDLSTKKIIIIASVITIILIIGIVIFKIVFTKKVIVQRNKLNNIGELIISVPETEMESYCVVYVFGGVNYATPKWVLTQTPNDLLYRAIVVFCPYTKPFSDIKPEADIFFKNNNITAKNLSIIGFSAGALNVQNAINDTFKFVGLIDPSTRVQHLQIRFNEKTRMVYNDANWGDISGIKIILPKLAEKINSLGGEAEKVNLQHDKIPAYFFQKYLHTIVPIED